MRILVTIPHYVGSAAGPHGSGGVDPRPRVQALRKSVTALYRHFGGKGHAIATLDGAFAEVNQGYAAHLDVVIRTIGDTHVLPHLALPDGMYEHLPAEGDPRLLGFACHEVLRDRLGAYDIYGYIEDDLVIHDPLFFLKLAWFNEEVGKDAVLQPNRYESSPAHYPSKFYIDGDAPVGVAFAGERDSVEGALFNRPVRFVRALNPHSGCFFLSAVQMALWLRKGMEIDTRWVGPLESAATLHLMKHFRAFKPAMTHAAFLEIQHFGTAFIERCRVPPIRGHEGPPPRQHQNLMNVAGGFGTRTGSLG